MFYVKVGHRKSICLQPVLWIHLILMRIRIQVIYLRFTEFFSQIIVKFFVLFFSLIFILKLDELLRNEEIFIISLFSKVQIWGLGEKRFFLQFLVDILPLCGSGSRKPKSCGSES